MTNKDRIIVRAVISATAVMMAQRANGVSAKEVIDAVAPLFPEIEFKVADDGESIAFRPIVTLH